MEEARAEWHVWNFAQWMMRSKEAGLGYPSRASGGILGYGSQDWDSEYDDTCRRLADATEAVVDSIQPMYRKAVYAQHLGGLWPLPDVTLGPYYRVAVGLVGRGLDKRGVV